ncbi:MAG: hypothetical protein HC769_04550 [Cyanobacteria bacterium CRU_2_1]|nr:hypothetical protein [Cyanobacteria bacterium RU_5_0]NJR58184.1 hypothetical protein [Cyanobacteria bacterium CRU_2_1]
MNTHVPTSVAVVLRIGSGSFDQGFPVTLRILEDGRLIQEEENCTQIPPAPDLPKLYENWQALYKQLGKMRAIQPVSGQVTNHSLIEACQLALRELATYLRAWFAQSPFRSLRHQIVSLTPSSPVPLTEPPPP